MRFHALLPVRDEADIIGQSLRHLLAWADAVYVFDTGSVDDTWDIVGDLAATDDRMRLLGRDPVFFSETRLRGWMFHQARRHMQDGDWFLRVDADEFHHVPPPEFVQTRLRPHETIVFHQYYDFRLTAAEVQAWQAGKETLADRARPVEQRRRSFTVSAYSEPRLCRYRATMRWPPTVSFPYNAGFRARARLPIRHYPHRDPVQLEQRCRLRAAMMADAENRRHWTRPDQHHWSNSDWQSFIMPDDHPDLQHWQSGAPLPEFRFTAHLAQPHVRAAQRIAHACLLPMLDRLRARYPDDVYPQRISADEVKRIRAELREELAVQDAAALPA
jgi:Glycosyl transferase family 2